MRAALAAFKPHGCGLQRGREGDHYTRDGCLRQTCRYGLYEVGLRVMALLVVSPCAVCGTTQPPVQLWPVQFSFSHSYGYCVASGTHLLLWHVLSRAEALQSSGSSTTLGPLLAGKDKLKALPGSYNIEQWPPLEVHDAACAYCMSAC